MQEDPLVRFRDTDRSRLEAARIVLVDESGRELDLAAPPSGEPDRVSGRLLPGHYVLPIGPSSRPIATIPLDLANGEEKDLTVP